MKILFAPLQGVTEAHFRKAFENTFGNVDAYYAPFITATERKKSNRSLFKDIFPESNDTSSVVPQLLSNNGSDFSYFASVIRDMGYEEINWNIGCPFPIVRKKKRGSGILPYPKLIRQVLDEVCKNLDYALTVKMRLGLYDSNEGIEVIKVLNDYPLKSIMIHARTGQQMYTGSVDLDGFETLYEQSVHEVTYNGDIYTYEDYQRIMKRFPGLKTIMLGRGALADPFLPAQIKGITIPTQDKVKLIKSYHDAILTYYMNYPTKNLQLRERNITNKMKEFWIYTIPHLDSDGKFLETIKRATTLEDYHTIMSRLLGPGNEWRENL